MKMEKTFELSTGITLRKVMELVTFTEKFQSEIFFQKNNQKCNGKSILGLMSFLLVTKPGDTYNIVAEGKDADEAITRITLLLKQLHSNGVLSYWEEEGLETVQQAMNESITRWNPKVRQVAKSYLK